MPKGNLKKDNKNLKENAQNSKNWHPMAVQITNEGLKAFVKRENTSHTVKNDANKALHKMLEKQGLKSDFRVKLENKPNQKKPTASSEPNREYELYFEPIMNSEEPIAAAPFLSQFNIENTPKTPEVASPNTPFNSMLSIPGELTALLREGLFSSFNPIEPLPGFDLVSSQFLDNLLEPDESFVNLESPKPTF